MSRSLLQLRLLLVTRYPLLIALLLLAFILTGCGTSLATLDVNTTKVVHFEPPPALLMPCHPNPPIAVETYVAFPPHEREEYLTDYSTHLLTVIRDCNNKLDRIRDLTSPPS